MPKRPSNEDKIYLSKKEEEVIYNIISKAFHKGIYHLCITKIIKCVHEDDAHLLIEAVPYNIDGKKMDIDDEINIDKYIYKQYKEYYDALLEVIDKSKLDNRIILTSETFNKDELFKNLTIPRKGHNDDDFMYCLKCNRKNFKLYLELFWKDAQKVLIKSDDSSDLDYVQITSKSMSEIWSRMNLNLFNQAYNYVSKIAVTSNKNKMNEVIVTTTLYLKTIKLLQREEDSSYEE